MKQAGTDMIFIDDATATKDMISVKMYREFSLPYLTRLVDEIHNLGMKAVLIYFGGISDRVEDILGAGADGLLMETSMKSFVNDLDSIAAQVNNRTLMFGNLNPREDVELKSDAELEAAMSRQIAVGKKYGRFVVSAGSPLTPGTSLARMQKYIELSRSLSEY
jgi:uroporphyrinogen decarboxylase